MSASSDYLRVLTDITQQKGATQAATARANAQIWGNSVARLGDFASDAIKQYGIDKKAKQQEDKDKAWEDLFKRSSAEFEAQQQPSMAELTGGTPGIVSEASGIRIGDSIARDKAAGTYQTPEQRGGVVGPELKTARVPRSSPFPTPAELLAVGGPERAIPVINAIVALQKIKPGMSPEDKTKAIQTFYAGFKKMTETQKREAYPVFLELFERNEMVPPGMLPRQWDAQTEAFIEGTEGKTGTPKADYTLNGQRYSGTTNQPIAGTATTEKLPTTVEALRTIAANSKDPRQAEAASILENLPDSLRITGPEMDERYRKIMAKPAKARTGDEVAWAGAYERQKAVSQPAVIVQTNQGPASVDRRTNIASPITTREGQTVLAPTTQPQAQDATFAKRLDDAGAVLDRLAPKIAKMSLLEYEAQLRLPAAAQSKDFQEYDQAARNLINSILRRESGAAIASSEFSDARRQYLAQPGNGPDVLKQKVQNRNRQREGFIKGAGPAYTPDVPSDKVRVKGPNGEHGTMPKSSALPTGWSLE